MANLLHNLLRRGTPPAHKSQVLGDIVEALRRAMGEEENSLLHVETGTAAGDSTKWMSPAGLR